MGPGPYPLAPRPYGSLGIPDIALAEARAIAANNVQINKQWAECTAPVGLTLAYKVITGATVVMTPKSTGRFIAWITGGFAGGPDTGILTVSHGAASIVPVYTPVGVAVLATAEGVNNAMYAVVVDLAANGFTAPLGVPVAINAIGSAVGAALSVLQHGLQLEVAEY